MDNWLENDIFAKVFALFVAIAMWFMVANEQNPEIEKTIDVSLSVDNLPTKLSIIAKPERISVKITGKRNVVNLLGVNDIKASVDLKNATEGKKKYPVNLGTPKNVSVSAIPSKVKIHLESYREKVIPVVIKTSGSPLQGYFVGKPIFKPTEITVAGLRPILEKIKRAVIFVDITNAHADVSAILPVKLEGLSKKEATLLKELTPKTINVFLPIKRMESKTVSVRASILNKLPEMYNLNAYTLTPDKVTVYGPTNILDTVDYIHTEPVEVGTEVGSQEKKVRLKLVNNITTDVKEVKVVLEVKQEQGTKVIDDVPVNISNAPANTDISINPSRVRVTLQGTKESIADFTSAKVKVVAQLKDYNPGKQVVDLKVQLPEGITAAVVEPQKVTVTVQSKN